MNADTASTDVLVFRSLLAAFVAFGAIMLFKLNRVHCPETDWFGRALDLQTRRNILMGVLIGLPVCMFVDHALGLLFVVVIFVNAVARGLRTMAHKSAREVKAASGFFGRISGALGWTSAARVASGADPLELEFEMLLLMSAVLGLFLSVSLGAIPFTGGGTS